MISPVLCATDVPDGDPKMDGEAKLGAGPIVNRGSTISPKVFDLLVEAADADGIPYAVNVSAGATNTDMDAAYASRAGTATGLISIPTRYIHTPTEVAAIADVDAAIRLVAAFAQRLGPGSRPNQRCDCHRRWCTTTDEHAALTRAV